ncbi:hypothetical protein SDC9_59213 [bioreactor metagenome]|uniref:Uncharacterized protein n=1 Tax=bioreactor metagenome TaxID=1076179 RepID=A0A644X9V9_9ZZZZ
MKIYRDHAALCCLAYLTPEAELSALVRRVYISSRSIEYPDEPVSLLGVAVLDPQTLPDEAERQLGFPVARNRWTGIGPNEEGFAPWWEIIESFEHWYELTFVLSDDGSGMVVYVPKEGDGEITQLCATYAKEGACP